MAKQLNIDLNVKASTEQAKQALNQLSSQLKEIQNIKNMPVIPDEGFKKAAQAAAELERHLQSAVNVNTGKLDLNKFNQSLNRSNTSLKQLGQQLMQSGQTGQQAFLNLTKSIALADNSALNLGTKLGSLMTVLKNTARWQISSSILHGFMGAIQGAYGYAQDLDKSLNNIRIVTGYSAEKMNWFAIEANKAAKALSTTTTEYTNASLIYYQQGLSDKEVKARTDATIKLANVSRQSAEEVSDQMTAVWNNFAEGSDNLEYYIDVMAKLGATTASSTQEISTGLEKFAAVASTVGLSYEYATAALATVTAKTRQSAEVVGTAFKTLFARLQDLELGDTLEDGTTLGKYSAALNAVGVNIKDINGEVKDMDIILDELGSKWNTIAKDQQIALAQTVAGTRQYTQLIALMDNWDFMQKNLETARNAEGELDRQAKIYAESWEAARDRVKAALENIYGKLVDRKFFTDLANGIEDALSAVSGLIEGLGGLKGILLTVASVFMTHYAKEMPRILSNLSQNFQIIIGRGQQLKDKLLAEAQQQINQASQGLPMNHQTEVDTTVTAKVLAMTKALNIEMRNLSESEKAEYQAKIEQTVKNGEYLQGLAKEIDLLEEKANMQTQAVASSIPNTITVETDDGIQKEMTKNELLQARYNLIQSIQNLKNKKTRTDEETALLKKQNAELKTLTAAYQKLQNNGKKAFQIITQKIRPLAEQQAKINNVLNDATNRTNKWKQSLAEASKTGDFEPLRRSLLKYADEVQKTTNVDMTKFREEVENIKNSSGFEALFKQMENGTGVFQGLTTAANDTEQKIIKLMASLNIQPDTPEFIKLMEIFEELGVKGEVVKQALEKMKGSMNGLPEYTMTLSEGFMQLGSSLMSFNNVMNSVKRISDVFNDKDATTLEKISAVIGGLTAAIFAYNAISKLTSGIQNSLINLSKKKAAANLTEAGTTKTVTSATGEQTPVTQANATAWWSHPIIAIIAAAALIAVAAITALSSAMSENTEELEENASKQREKLDSMKEEQETNKNLIKSMKDLMEQYKTDKSKKEELDEVTRQLAEAYNIEGAALAALNGNYDDFYSKAIKAQKESLQDVQKQTEDTLKATGAAITGIANASEYTSDGKIDFGGFGANDQKAYNVLKDAGLANSYTEAGAFGIGGWHVGFNYDPKNVDSVIDAYNRVTMAMQELEKSGIDLQDVGIYEDMQDFAEELSEQIEAYGEVNQTFAIQQAELVMYDEETSKSLESYVAIKEETIKELVKAGLTLNQAEKAWNNAAINNLNPTIQKYQQLDSLIEDIFAKYNIDKNSEQGKAILDFFNKSGDTYSASALAMIDWTKVTEEGFETGVQNAQYYVDALEAVAKSTEELNIATTAFEKFQKALSGGISLDEYEKFKTESGMDWGQNGIIEWLDFMQLNQEQQLNYLYNYMKSKSQKALDDLKEKLNATIIQAEQEYQAMQEAWENDDFIAYEEHKTKWENLIKDIENTEIQIDIRMNLNSQELYNSIQNIIDQNYEIGAKLTIQDADALQSLLGDISDILSPNGDGTYTLLISGVELKERIKNHLEDYIGKYNETKKNIGLLEEVNNLSTNFDLEEYRTKLREHRGKIGSQISEQQKILSTAKENLGNSQYAKDAATYRNALDVLNPNSETNQRFKSLMGDKQDIAWDSKEEWKNRIGQWKTVATNSNVKYENVISVAQMLGLDPNDYDPLKWANEYKNNGNNGQFSTEAFHNRGVGKEQPLGATIEANDPDSDDTIPSKVTGRWSTSNIHFTDLDTNELRDLANAIIISNATAKDMENNYADESGNLTGHELIGYLNNQAEAYDQEQQDIIDGAKKALGGLGSDLITTNEKLGKNFAEAFIDSVGEEYEGLSAEDITSLMQEAYPDIDFSKIKSQEDFNGLLDEALEKQNAKLIQQKNLLLNNIDTIEELDNLYTDAEGNLRNIIDNNDYARKWEQLNTAMDFEGVDSQELADYSKHLQKAAKNAEDLDSKLEENADAAKIVAKSIMKMNDGIDDLASNGEEWLDILRKSSKSSEEYAQALASTRNAVGKLLDLNADSLSDDFFNAETNAENLALIEKAATGDAEAIDALRQKAFEDIVLQIDDSDARSKVFELQDLVNENFANMQAGATITPEMMNDGFLESLNALVTSAGLSVDQVNAIFDSMGFEAQFKKEPVDVEQESPVTVTETRERGYTTGHSTGPTGEPIEYSYPILETTTYQDGTKTYTGKQDVIAISTDGKTPTITGITKKAGGKMNNYSSSNAGGKSTGGKSGGGGGSGGKSPTKKSLQKKDDETERYHVVRAQLDDLSRDYDKASKAKDRLFGADRIKAINQEITAVDKLAKKQKQYLNEISSYRKKDLTAMTTSGKKGGIQYTVEDANGNQSLKTADVKGLKDWLGMDVLMDPNGVITNYEQIMEAAKKWYNGKINEYNAMSASQQEAADKNGWKDLVDGQYNGFMELLKQYEETNDLWQTEFENLLEKYREKQDLELEKFQYKVEIKVKLNDAEIKRLEYIRKSLADDRWKSVEYLTTLWNQQGKNSTYQQLLAQGGIHTAAAGELLGASHGDVELDANGNVISQPQYSDAGWMEALDAEEDALYNTIDALWELDDTMIHYYEETLSNANEKLNQYMTKMEDCTAVLEHYKNIMELIGKVDAEYYKNRDKILKAQQKTAQNEYDSAQKEYELAEQRYRDMLAEYENTDWTGNEAGKQKFEDQLQSAYEHMTEWQDKALSKAEALAEAIKAVYENAVEGASYEMEQALTGGLGFDELANSMDRVSQTSDLLLTKTNQIYETNKLMRQLSQDIDKVDSLAAKTKLKNFKDEIQDMQDMNEMSKFDLEVAKARYEVLKAQIALEEAQNAKSIVRLQRDNEGNYGYVYTADQDKVNDAKQALEDKQNDLYNLTLEKANESAQALAQLDRDFVEEMNRINTEYANDEEKRQELLYQLREDFARRREILEKDSNTAYYWLNQVAATDSSEAWASAYKDILPKTEEWKKEAEDYVKAVQKAHNDYEKDIREKVAPTLDNFDGKIEDVTADSEKYSQWFEDFANKNDDNMTAISNITNEYIKQRQAVLDLISELDNYIKKIDEVRRKEAGDVDEAAGEGDNENGNDNGNNDGNDNNDNGNGNDNTTVDEETKKHVAAAIWNGNYGWGQNPERAKRLLEVFGANNGIQVLVNQGYNATANYNPKGYSYLEMRKKIKGYDTGGYTGEWGNNGKLAFLHQKELVLNEQDTKNMLQSVALVRQLSDMIDLQALTSGFSTGISSPSIWDSSQTLEQMVTIHAEFPNAVNHNEIEEAFNTLVNRASQYANRSRR